MTGQAKSKVSAVARPTKRVRRSTGEVIDRLIEAAVEEFEGKGFSGATTAAIAKRAGVAEALLFNHFGSKAQLFQDTIFNPLDRHFDDFHAAHPGEETDASRRAQAIAYIAELQGFVSEHSGMLLSLVFAQSYKPVGVDGLARVKGLHDYFARMAGIAAGKLKDNPTVDPKWMARISFATILSCGIFGEWLFPDGAGHEDEIRDAISDFVMDGLNANKAFLGGE